MEQTQVGHYRIVRLLGRGGMGEVYEAEDLELHRHVALKFVISAFAHDDESRRRLEREARSAAALHHPHIAALWALERDGDRPFISMELLKGTTLRALLASGQLSIEHASEIVRDVADALAYAHTRPDPVVHRDIKPENLMFDDRQHIKITDFGLAKASQATNLTMEGTSVGTPVYMAPECALGPAGAPADVFALGAVLYELLVGRVPFEGANSLAAMFAIASQATPSLRAARPEAPEALEALVTRMLSKAPEDRPTAAQVAAALGSTSTVVANEAPTVAIPRGRLETPVKREPKRAPPRTLGAVFVFLGLLAAGGLAFMLVIWPGMEARRHAQALNANNRGIEAMNRGNFDEARAL